MQYFELKNLPSLENILAKELPEPSVLLTSGDENYTLAFGVDNYFVFKISEEGDFEEKLNQFVAKNNGRYHFGYFSYDLKNVFEDFLKSSNRDDQEFLYAYFFTAKHVFIRGESTSYYYGEKEEHLNDLLKSELKGADFQNVELKEAVSREAYLEAVIKIKEEIQQGNVYELNYCTDFVATAKDVNFQEVYRRLVRRTHASFGAFLNLKHQHVLCGSPERFLNKSGSTIYSQPIKGTAKRGLDDAEDQQLISHLLTDSKELAENVMIVDLVRNDLSKVAERRSVHVEKLNEVKSFKTVHQLVSTVSCQVNDSVSPANVIRAAFPMGSMTGAPKISAMELSERFENFKRGIYSGTIGFIDPMGNFDFNVVIRSIIHHKETGRISVPVGGAITIQSDPEKEYEECLVKLAAMREVLSGSSTSD